MHKITTTRVWNARWLFHYLFKFCSICKLGKDLFSQLPNATSLNFLPQWHHCDVCSPDTGRRTVLTLTFWPSRYYPAAAFAQVILHFGRQFVIQVASAQQTPAYNAFTVDDTVCPVAFSPQPLQPHVRVWDSVSLATLQVIGLGTFERGVGCLDFSKAVRRVPLLCVWNSLTGAT